jgi:Zn-dependent protease with chaperone function
MGDDLKSLALGLLSSALTLWIPYLLLRKSPRRWWIYTSVVAVPVVLLIIALQPVYIDPLFNKFGPMRDKALEAQILATAERAGIEGGRVFEVAKSEDTEALNAYVTGFGGSQRIVLWDTLLRKMDAREVVFVMGHEMGHYVLGHILIMLCAVGVLILSSLYAVHALSGWLIRRFRHRFGFTELGDVASYPLLVVVLAAVNLALTPMLFVLTRHNEHEADRFGLELTRDNRAAAMAFVKLQEENLSVPYPGTFYKLFRASHPPLGERIDFANTYRPWETGEPMKYAERFRK